MQNTSSIPAHSKVFFNDKGYGEFNRYLQKHSFSKVFVLVDGNTHKYCLSPFLSRIQTRLEIEIIEMATGEDHKNLETCNEIWKVLSELGGDRKSLLINLGGGVVTDLGGFVAAAFKRGIPCIHFPTTLLAMVDAAVGGKNGVNLDGLKNQIGVIKEPGLIVADISFLATLPAREMRSGLAEMFKHGLIRSEEYWNKITALDKFYPEDLESLITESIKIKERIVLEDPTEQHVRKALNFGHTLGHGIETFFLEDISKEKLLHGEAVAAGMIMAAFLSHKLLDFPEEKLQEITDKILTMYGGISIKQQEEKKIIDLLKFDKKNEGGKINFVLLKKIGEPIIDCHVPNSLLHEAFSYYSDSQQFIA